VQRGRHDHSETCRDNHGAYNIHRAVLVSVDILIRCENDDDQGYADHHNQAARG
jgi:hypothetical protein